MSKSILGVIIASVVLAACTISSTPSSASNDELVVTSSDDSLKGAIVTINEIRYNCIKYSTEGRGGLWCEKQ